MPHDDPYRLPRSVVPRRYELTITPDLDASTFTGTVAIEIDVAEPVDLIVLNALDLDVQRAELTTGVGVDIAVDTIDLDAETQRVSLGLAATASPGPAVLYLEFGGEINDKLCGFYRSTFTDGGGAERVIATTHFEPTDARHAFPCWDEPDFKAVFGVTLVVADDLLAVSNGPAVEEADEADGRRRIRFADTIPMSTYLVAYVVGPLVATDPVDVDGVPLRVICTEGKTGMAGLALEVGAHSLRFFGEYFGIAYPADKLDLIALPDFAMGAMENLGCVTFRETALLVDAEKGSHADMERVADVVAHEIAHMWFGDLVTMKWWNGIWLNEAFATFMEMLCVDAFRPEWNRWVTFGRSRSAAMIVDGLATTRTIEFPVHTPEECEDMFDVLTYQKGAAVLRMLEQYLGADEFRSGIRHYLDAHRFGNAESGDLWDAIETATDQPVRAVMDSWIFQEGYPVISVESDGATVVVGQQRFRYDDTTDPTTWQVPVLIRDGEARNRTLLTAGQDRVELGDVPTALVVNEGGSGFYRVNYARPALDRLLASPTTLLTPLERLNLVADAWAAAVAGVAPLGDFLAIAQLGADETDPNVWWTVADGLGFLTTFLDGDDLARYLAWSHALLRRGFDAHGWEAAAGEPETMGQLRSTILTALGTWAGDEEIRAEAVRRFRAGPDGAVHPDLVGAVVTIAAQAGGPAEYERLVDSWRHPATPQEETRSLYALAEFRQEDLVERTLDLVMSEVRTQNASFVLLYLLGNDTAHARTWQFIEKRWDDIRTRIPEGLIARIFHEFGSGRTAAGIAGFDAELAQRVETFVETNPVPAGARTIAQGVERMRVNVAFRERERAALQQFTPRHGVTRPTVEVFAVGDTTAQITWRGLPAGSTIAIELAGTPLTAITADLGAGAVTVDGLAPSAVVSAQCGGASAQATTLAAMPGPVRLRVATMNDLHVGERCFGYHRTICDPREPPYPQRCLDATLREALAWGADLVILKGDLTDGGRPTQWRSLADTLRAVLDKGAHDTRVVAINGNHDVKHSAVDGGPFLADAGVALITEPAAQDIAGLRVVFAQTAHHGDELGDIDDAQRARLVELLRAPGAEGGTPPPALVVTHHQLQLGRYPTYYPGGVVGAPARQFLAAVAEAQPDALVVTGHSHRHRFHARGARWAVPVAELGSTKDYPGTWAGYEVFDGGIRQIVRRVAAPDPFEWTELSRRAVAGQWPRWSSGHLDDRCWNYAWPSSS